MKAAANTATVDTPDRSKQAPLQLRFHLSEQAKFAVKSSLSLVLAYLIAFSQGWSNASTAATTIMLIAATGSLGDSVMKGLLRVAGTLIGAVIGITLIALFPQERTLYLLSASLIVTVLLYFARAYKGDMTIFLLAGITLMMMFQNGEVDYVFLYGVDKTFMTVFGIVVYTLVGLFLWPVSVKDNNITQAEALVHAQHTLFRKRDASREERTAHHQEMLQAQQALTQTLGKINSSAEENFTRRQWTSVLNDFKKIAENLTLLAYHDKTPFADDIARFVPDFPILEQEIEALFGSIERAWTQDDPIDIPKHFTAKIDHTQIEKLTHLERASLTSTLEQMSSLHEGLRSLADKLNAYNAPQPTHFSIEETLQSTGRFIWFDTEHLKASLVTFLIFWTGSLLWIHINPPGGFLIVALATGLSVITAFTPVKPSLLIIVFSLAFVYATLMYIAVLPNLTYGWELALFIFVYGFIGFYFMKPEVSIFFLMGMLTLNISNQMYYAFDLFLLVLLIFYAFLFLLLLFYYLPFSTKPEHLFLTMKRRLFDLAAILVDHNRNKILGRHSLWSTLKAAYARHHLMNTAEKMLLWANQIDEKYFDTLKKEDLLTFAKSCKTFAFLLQTMYRNDRDLLQNPLIRDFLSQHRVYTLVPVLKRYATQVQPEVSEAEAEEREKIIAETEERLRVFDTGREDSNYTQEQIMHFYTSISLHKSVWTALFECSDKMAKLDLKVLENSRF